MIKNNKIGVVDSPKLDVGNNKNNSEKISNKNVDKSINNTNITNNYIQTLSPAKIARDKNTNENEKIYQYIEQVGELKMLLINLENQIKNLKKENVLLNEQVRKETENNKKLIIINKELKKEITESLFLKDTKDLYIEESKDYLNINSKFKLVTYLKNELKQHYQKIIVNVKSNKIDEYTNSIKIIYFYKEAEKENFDIETIFTKWLENEGII
ncbi:hypothetical protein [Spiroplasma endosymbiont of Glossina fuscipes fuscipes]|uniref:hypothetical protein n=1 Tax=Spiroplasma endosymbiont of Glossina fuscipes fuscipes TaxID=2004463 RepID=UPI003C72322B